MRTRPKRWHRALLYLIEASGPGVCRGVRQNIFACRTPADVLTPVGDRYPERLDMLLAFAQTKLGLNPGHALQVLIRTSQPRWDTRPRCLTTFARSLGWVPR